jgi:hypothetical protein
VSAPSRPAAPRCLFPVGLALLFLVALTVYFLFPLSWLVVSSTKDTA